MCCVSDCYLVEVGRTFSNKGNQKIFQRGTYVPYVTIDAYCKEHDYYSLFQSAYRYSTSNLPKAELYGDFYLDLDDEQDFEKVRKDAITVINYLKIVYHICPDDIEIFFSGCKGLHVIVPAALLGVEPDRYLNSVYKYIASSINKFTKNKTIDLQIYDSRRMFRIANTVHEKTKLYKIRLSYEELKILSHDEIKQIAKEPREYTRSEITCNSFAKKQFEQVKDTWLSQNKYARQDIRCTKTISFCPYCIAYILENGAQEGQRNNTTAALANYYKASGRSLSEALTLISDWNSNNSIPLGERELETTVRSIYSNQYNYGCATLKTLSKCDERCKFYR